MSVLDLKNGFSYLRSWVTFSSDTAYQRLKVTLLVYSQHLTQIEGVALDETHWGSSANGRSEVMSICFRSRLPSQIASRLVLVLSPCRLSHLPHSTSSRSHLLRAVLLCLIANMGTLFMPDNFVVAKLSIGEIKITSIAWGFQLGFTLLTAVKAAIQTIRIWRRTGRITGYVLMVWLERLVNTIFGVLSWLCMNGTIPSRYVPAA